MYLQSSPVIFNTQGRSGFNVPVSDRYDRAIKILFPFHERETTEDSFVHDADSWAAEERAQPSASQAVVEIEYAIVAGLPDVAFELSQLAARTSGKLNHVGDVRIEFYKLGVLRFHQNIDSGIGKSRAQNPQKRRCKNDIANRAEPDYEDFVWYAHGR
jgi:hypothetical protein